MNRERCAMYGRRAIERGTPDFGANGHDEDGINTDACDAIANILHAVESLGGKPRDVLRIALDHFEHEAVEYGPVEAYPIPTFYTRRINL